MIESVGIIGSGPLGQALARHLVKADLRVLISNSRGPASLIDVVNKLGDRAQAVTVRDAAQADLVILGIPFLKVPELRQAVPDWSGRVVVDATNQFAQYEPTYDGFVDLGEETGSEWVARQLPGATIVKAFNAMFASYIAADPQHAEGRQVVFYAGDDDSACKDFAQLVDRIGFAPVFVGGLRDGGRLMQLGGPLSALHVIRQG
ncbi:MAG: 8-hydroxy-5-deazaflavin:NADPH oxidoreductase [Mycobacterium sp.]|jgi:predicted dinucleotide-binding enzyme|nr:oxidoreductase [Mycobacterium sp.]MDT5132083.1 8-hydroxy-5-deazaflavin:NADPH oxidoreductase [Mycobacterium sp.]